MTCCGPATDLDPSRGATPDEISLASKDLGGGRRQSVLSVPDMHCGVCIGAIEKSLARLDGVTSARANLTRRRVTVNWVASERQPDLAGALSAIGYRAYLPGDDEDLHDPVQAHLVRALAVAGFSSMNIMLLAVSVWAGADDGTRHAFQMVSAALAVPAVIYSGSSFYRSAWGALSNGRLNMDVPISAGVLLSFALSLYDATTNAAQAYFEASTSLLFVLLAGRLLDHTMRRKARSAVTGLARLMPQGADIVAADGAIIHVPVSELSPGCRILVLAGACVPTDGVVVKGRAELDAAMLTGESARKAADIGDEVRAGEVNLGDPFEMRASVSADGSVLADMARLLAAAEDGRTRYRRLADRAAALYAPAVHSLAAAAFVFWLYASGDLHKALTIAIAVLVITCPCALGLAVPMVQVALTRRLYGQGVLATDGTAFERLARVDTVVFDKTGTLTTGEPALVRGACGPDVLALAASLARHSKHPYSRALAAAHVPAGSGATAFETVHEVAGCGVEARTSSGVYRLGKPGWAGGDPDGDHALVLSLDGLAKAGFSFSETIRPGAASILRQLRERGLDTMVLSGDSRRAVAAVAGKLDFASYEAGVLPARKAEIVRALQAAGCTVLMIGDGINDAAALRTADVSMAPVTASDIGRSASDFVFLGADLSAVGETMAASRAAIGLVRQNFALAALYNLASLPLAFSGQVTPLTAALAMSSSSILVVLNSLRLVIRDRVGRKAVSAAAREVPA